MYNRYYVIMMYCHSLYESSNTYIYRMTCILVYIHTCDHMYHRGRKL